MNANNHLTGSAYIPVSSSESANKYLRQSKFLVSRAFTPRSAT
ncbi:MAG: hypothetical protein ACR2IA_01590 [Pyrinomonadaceae bacterium]